MRIDYWILVVDDQPAYVESVRESVGQFLDDEGLSLHWQPVSGADSLTAELRRNRAVGTAPDLVLVDNKLGKEFEGNDGPHWAGKVRQAFPFTDILFYSSAGLVRELRVEIFNAGVDGVYSCNRDKLDEEAKQLIRVHVQRWLEPPATRALVVGQVVEFDEHFRLLAGAFAKATERAVLEKVAAKYSSQATDNLRRKSARMDEYTRNGDVQSLVHDQDLGSYWLPDVARELLGVADPDASQALLLFLKAYREHVLKARNLLAHGQFNSERSVFIGGKGEEYPSTPESCRRLRVALRAYRAEIEKLAGLTPGMKVEVNSDMPLLF